MTYTNDREAFLYSADDRETDAPIMDAIWSISAKSLETAKHIWDSPTPAQLQSIIDALRLRRLDPAELVWGSGGLNWYNEALASIAAAPGRRDRRASKA